MYRTLQKLMLSALVCAAACGPKGPPDLGIYPDLNGPSPDLSSPPDLGPGPDLRTDRDMTGTQVDLSGGGDLATGDDLATTADDMTGGMPDLVTGTDMPMMPDMSRMPDMAMGHDMPMMADMTRPGSDGGMCDGSTTPTDLRVAPTGHMIHAKEVGAPCKANADCTQGTTPLCWTATLFNKAGLLPVKDGYCSSGCTMDTDCGVGNTCVDFGADGKACLAGCGDAVTCRHPGYVCAILGGTAAMPLTGCFPDSNFDCNPEVKTCTEGATGGPGACLRTAIEDDHGGFCVPLCQPGDTCPMDIFGEVTGCIELDLTRSGDAFSGTLCFPNTVPPKNPGDACTNVNDCIDGSQCDVRTGGTGKCQKLCSLGKATPACPMGTTCQNVFGLCGGAGLCE